METKKQFIVTVSQLNRKIALMLGGEKTFSDLCVRGEISDLKMHSASGHYYFTLKDADSAVSAVLYNFNVGGLTVRPENGMKVIVRGSVSCFEKRGIYNIKVADIMLDGTGEGDLSSAFDKLKERLEKEGLFAQKRPIPAAPDKICVITSETGAVLQDIRNVLTRRCPQVRVVLIPATVQGELAVGSIVRAFGAADKTDADVIIFGRGGGSSEDLAAFNDEAVVRAVFGSRIPTISAVGHETDFTLADFAADKRAPTPSAAAELAVPDNAEQLARLEAKKDEIRRALSARFYEKEAALDTFESDIRIKLRAPVVRLENRSRELETLSDRIKKSMRSVIDSKERSLISAASVIEALDPLKILMRGYSVTYFDGKAVISADEVKKGDPISIRLSDGSIKATVDDTEK